MQEDDYYAKKKATNSVPQPPANKAIKTTENQRVPSVITKIQSPLKKEGLDKPKADETFNAALEAIRMMKKKQQESVVNAKVNFAG